MYLLLKCIFYICASLDINSGDVVNLLQKKRWMFDVRLQTKIIIIIIIIRRNWII